MTHRREQGMAEGKAIATGLVIGNNRAMIERNRNNPTNFTLPLWTLILMLWMLVTPQWTRAQPEIHAHPGQLAHTFSIVARDPGTGEIGVAVQSHWFAVGTTVAWAEAGVGAVATQSFIDPSYGPLGLALMHAGKTAPQALKGLLETDPGRAVRQVAMIDAQGNVMAYTGDKCIPEAGQIMGKNYSVQANLMLSSAVWGAMSRAFETTRGDLAGRMLSALEAAQAAGGDIRGRQAAALIVVRGKSTGRPWQDRLVDLRVDDSPHPIRELKRLLQLHRAYAHMNQGDLAVEHHDDEGALKEYGAAEALFPENLEMKFWHATALVNMKRLQEALPLFKEIFSRDTNWTILVGRLPKVGLLPDDPSIVQKILSVAPGGWNKQQSERKKD